MNKYEPKLLGCGGNKVPFTRKEIKLLSDYTAYLIMTGRGEEILRIVVDKYFEQNKTT